MIECRSRTTIWSAGNGKRETSGMYITHNSTLLWTFLQFSRTMIGWYMDFHQLSRYLLLADLPDLPDFKSIQFTVSGNTYR